MNIIKVYEGFLDKMYEKLPEGKLAIALVNFMNIVKPELKCKYLRNSDGLWIVVNDDIRIMHMDLSLKYVQITFFAHHKEEYTDKIELDILYFLFEVFDTDIIDVDIYKSDIPQAISKLTKDNYDTFITKKFAKKYNL